MLRVAGMLEPSLSGVKLTEEAALDSTLRRLVQQPHQPGGHPSPSPTLTDSRPAIAASRLGWASDVRSPCLPVSEQTRRQQQQSAKQREGRVNADANQPQGQRNQQNQRSHHQGKQGNRPAQDQEDTPSREEDEHSHMQENTAPPQKFRPNAQRPLTAAGKPVRA